MTITKKETGFTLIELLVVISIIGLLASVVLVSLNATRGKARDAKRVSDMNQMAKAMELFFNENSTYPTNNVAVGTFGTMMNCAAGTAGCVPGLVPRFVAKIPEAPLPPDGVCQVASNPYNSYRYDGTGTTGCPNCKTSNYTITFCLGAPTGGLTTGGSHTLTAGGFQ